MYVSPKARDEYITAYDRALRRALDDIVTSIPAVQLAIQWDVCQEVLVYENFFADRPIDYKRRIVDELGRLGNAVPSSIEMITAAAVISTVTSAAWRKLGSEKTLPYSRNQTNLFEPGVSVFQLRRL